MVADAVPRPGAAGRHAATLWGRARASATFLVFSAVGMAVLILDLASKEAAFSLVGPPISLPREIIPEIVELKTSLNPGGLWGYGSDLPGASLISPTLGALAVAALVAVHYWARGARAYGLAIATGLLAGGSLGNIYDRICHGGVRDFVHVHFDSIDLDLPIFNIAALALGASSLVLPALLFRFFMRPTPLRGWVMAKVEARAFRTPTASRPEFRQTERGSRFFPLPRAFLVALGFDAGILAVLIAAAPASVVGATILGTPAVMLGLLLLGVICSASLICHALMLHFRPDSDRKRKYESLLSGICIPGAWTVLPMIVWAVAGVGMSCLTRPRTASRVVRRAHRVVRALSLPLIGVWAIALAFSWFSYAVTPFVLILPLTLALFIARYMVYERLAASPILYLRSFSDKDGAIAFGEVVARVASRHGVLVALVHARQPGSDLFSRTRITDQAEVYTASDDQWQIWVERYLGRSSAVVIDGSVLTASVKWEIETSLQLAGPDRVIILRRCNAPSPVEAPENCIMEYDLDELSLRQVREALDVQLRRVLA